jgi:hypothetical protein
MKFVSHQTTLHLSFKIKCCVDRLRPPPDFGHFSEWVLAATYFECGLKIGYLPEARIHHYYIGYLPELKTFTLDFVEGEIRYFSQQRREPGSTLLEPPPELICQDNFAPDMARGILRMAVRDILTSSVAYRRWKQGMFAIGRWAAPAMFGDGIARGTCAVVTLYARLGVMLALVIGSREWLSVRFKLYIAALIQFQRLNCIRAERLSRAVVGTPDSICGLDRNAVLNQTGFYPLEEYQGIQFRWSETAAAVRIRTDKGSQSVRIKCVPIRKLSEMDLRFYLDGKRVPGDAISIDANNFEIRFDLAKSGTHKLGWICRPFKAAADRRRLGLPIMQVGVQTTAAKEGVGDEDDRKAV